MRINEFIKGFSLLLIAQRIVGLFPKLKKELWIAQINQKPEEYIRDKLKNSLMVALAMGVLTFFLVDKQGSSYLWIPVSYLIFFSIVFYTLINGAHTKVLKLRKEIDREVLFAGRFLLVKLNSGVPLINALTEASKSYGVANEYFKSIVHDIEMGTNMEDALQKAVTYSPSERMKKILFQITNALKIGIDVTQSLQATLEQIAEEQLIEIQRYGKKLNGITMFYMLGAVVLPSLGFTMFIVIASVINFQADKGLYVTLAFFLIIIELVFLSIFKAIRPNVNI
ncbi:MAG: type II secretion system F family protein [archaeon]